MPPRRCLTLCLTVALACAAGTPRYASAQNPAAPPRTGSIFGWVTILETGTPLPSVDVTVMETGQATFGNADGRFYLRNVPSGTVRLRVRRLGFTPVTLVTFVPAGQTDSVYVALPLLAIRLNEVRVAGGGCGSRSDPRSDSATVAILNQVSQNAERTALFAREYPHDMVMERVIGNMLSVRRNVREASRIELDTLRVDTTTVGGEHDWRYEPGKLIVSVNDPVLGPTEKMVVPMLSDFADRAFVSTHCFKYAGLSALDGVRMIRVDFEPARGVPEPDLRGSLYLDTLSYQIRRSILNMERRAPRDPRQIWTTRVETWFKESAPAQVVIDRIEHRTTGSSTTPRVVASPQAAVEIHTLLDVRFHGPKPP